MISELCQGSHESSETRQLISELCQLSHEGLKPSQQCQLKELLEQFADNFAARDKDCTQTRLLQHDTDTGLASPVRLRPWRPLAKRAAAEQPTVLVKKKDGSWCFCPLPRIDNVINDI